MYSYYNIDVSVNIGDKVVFDTIHSATIINAMDRISDTAKLELPSGFTNRNKKVSIAKKSLLNYVSVGDRITIQAGYDEHLKTEFEGYITDLGADVPILLSCEDEMYQLRTGAELNKTFAKVSLKELLQFIAPNYKVSAQDIQLGKFMIAQETPYKVLENLRQQYGIRSYFDGKVLNAGLPVGFKVGNTHTFVIGENTRKSSQLKYKRQKDRKCWVKAISMQKGISKQVVYEFGDKGGSSITLHAPLNLSVSELEKWAKDYYKSVVFDGYEGNIDTWGQPFTRAGDAANIINPQYSDGQRNGRYLIESVKTYINGSVGLKRENRISLKI